MRLTILLPLLVLPGLCFGHHLSKRDDDSSFTPQHLRELKNRTRILFYHGWNSYIKFGFPADEVRPVSCEPYGPQFTHKDNNHLDAMGNVSLTVLDNLDTLMMLGDWDELSLMLKYLKRNQELFFNQNHVVQVFEASIRWLGGLLLVHLALTDNVLYKMDGHGPRGKLKDLLSQYDGFLLRMAYDLGLRLIPAYNTSTSLPLPRINLKTGLKGVRTLMNQVGCTAGATTPLLEFTLLLRLTGDLRFETLTNTTFWKLWSTRLELGMLPMTIDPAGNRWLDVVTGVGALVDSFYEYALKASIVLQDNLLLDVFSLSYEALRSHLAVFPKNGSWMLFANVHVSSLDRVNLWIDLLSAFWPGLQVLAGRLSDAVSTHLTYLKIWDHYDSIPERWEQQSLMTAADPLDDQVKAAISLEWYPLRPEFIESTYYLYRATKDPIYLQIGVRILTLFETQYKTVCGFTGFQDVRSGLKQNRMETFVLGELLKYLYLLFDTANESYVHAKHMNKKNWVFSTEAHPLWYREEMGAQSRAKFQRHLSSQETKLTEFSGNGFLSCMWREFINTFGDSTAQSSPRVEVVSERTKAKSLLGANLKPVSDQYAKCELAPQQWPSHGTEWPFRTSGFCDWDQVFMLNNHLASTLVRPSHLSTYDKSSVIELTPSFLNTHCLGKHLKSARPPTTGDMDFNIGEFMRPEAYEMYRVHSGTKNLFQENDLVLPLLGGRLKLERLVNNTISRENTYIGDGYVDKYTTQSWPVDWEVFRIHTVNGYPLSANNTLWTKGSALLGRLSVFEVNEQGVISIGGRFVENLKAF